MVPARTGLDGVLGEAGVWSLSLSERFLVSGISYDRLVICHDQVVDNLRGAGSLLDLETLF